MAERLAGPWADRSSDVLEQVPIENGSCRNPAERSAPSRKKAPDYVRQTKRPVVCLAFVLPLLLVYELGSICTDQLSGKSGVDQWTHQWMDSVGIGHLVILPWVTAGVLLFWHHRLQDDWQFRPQIMLGMLLECCCLGTILFFAGNAVHQILASDGLAPVLAIVNRQPTGVWESSIAYIGCGVYEELIFRLLLLNGLIYLGRKFCRVGEAAVIGTLLSSLLFAGLHYEVFNPAGAAFDPAGFLFRFAASVVFCVVFLNRGFGIAVGTHSIYDVLTQV